MTDGDLKRLGSLSKANPHRRDWTPMRLYMESQVWVGGVDGWRGWVACVHACVRAPADPPKPKHYTHTPHTHTALQVQAVAHAKHGGAEGVAQHQQAKLDAQMAARVKVGGRARGGWGGCRAEVCEARAPRPPEAQAHAQPKPPARPPTHPPTHPPPRPPTHAPMHACSAARMGGSVCSRRRHAWHASASG